MERKSFKNLSEAVQWLENQMIYAVLTDEKVAQLNFIDGAVEMSDLREANELIKYIMEK